MKKYLILLASLVLAACSVTEPNLTYSQKPILNITANLASAIDVSLRDDSALIKNKMAQPVRLTYHLYWYDAQGVTQLWQAEQESQTGQLNLNPNAQARIELLKPTPESKNYRLYLQ